MKIIKVTHRILAGSDRFIPECELGLMICDLVGQKTLTHKNLNVLRKYGYKIELVQLRVIEELIRDNEDADARRKN